MLTPLDFQQGVYGGVVASNNGDTADDSNLNSTAVRGIQVSDDDGVLQFTTLFPGHYTGRTAVSDASPSVSSDPRH